DGEQRPERTVDVAAPDQAEETGDEPHAAEAICGRERLQPVRATRAKGQASACPFEARDRQRDRLKPVPARGLVRLGPVRRARETQRRDPGGARPPLALGGASPPPGGEDRGRALPNDGGRCR